MTIVTRTAACNCGALRVETTGEPGAVVACHCVDCQRRTGSVVGVGAYYADDQVRITGESKSYTRDTASGGRFRQSFCPTCGTNLFWVVESKPGTTGIAVGGFADATFPKPVRSVWEQSHHTWLGLPDGIQHFDRATVRPKA